MNTFKIVRRNFYILKEKKYKKRKKRDWKKLLKLQEEKDKGIIITEITKKTNGNLRINFKCNCGEKYNKKVYNIINNSGLFCEYHTKINSYNKKIETNLKNLGVENPFQSEVIKEQIKQTNLKNLGVENPFQSKIVQEKSKQTCLKNLGVENPSQNKEVKQKKQKTRTKNGYNKNWEKLLKQQEIKDKSKIITDLDKLFHNEDRIDFECNCGKKDYKNIYNILIKRGGTGLFCESCTKINSNNKKIETCRKNWGVDNPSQSIKIHSKKKKTSYSTKEYIFKTGEIVEVQGYEPFGLKLLENKGYKYEDIKIEHLDIIYIFKGKKCHHFPDFYIPKENRIIEVKSTRTYILDLGMNKQKKKYSISQGYIYEFWVFDGKGNLEIF